MRTNKSKKNGQGDSVKTNLYWNTLVRIPVQVLNFAISIVVARILMPRDFGILGIAMMLIGYANIFTNFGFNQAIVQKQIVDKKMLNSIFTFDLVLSLLITAGFFFSADFIAKFFKTPECEKAVRVLSSVFLLTSFSALPHAILRRDMNFKAVSLLDVSQSVLTSVVTLVLALTGWGYWALVYGQILPLCIITLAYCIKARWIPGIYYDSSLMKTVYDFGIWNFLSSQINFISNHLDTFIIGRWLGPIELGLYDKSKAISSAPYNFLFININAVMFSSFSRTQEARGYLQKYFTKSLTLSSLMIFPIYSGLIIVAPHFVHSLLGEKWVPMILPFQIILFGSIFGALLGLIANFNIAIGKYRSQSSRLLCSTILFALSCSLLLRFGLTGIAFAFVIFKGSLLVLSMPLAISELDMPKVHIAKCILPGFLSALCMVVSVGTISYLFLTRHTISNLLLISGIGTILYFFCLVIYPMESIKEFRRMVLCDCKKAVSVIFR